MNSKLSQLIITCFCGCLTSNAAEQTKPVTIEDDFVISDEKVEDITSDANESDKKDGSVEVPDMFRDDSMLDNSRINQELGVNVYTAPSISKIFNQLEGLPPIPDTYVLRNRPELLATESGKLALAMGFLLADGFIAVRSGRMNDIKPIALNLSRYGKTMGVGDRMNMHSASLLEQAEKGLLEQFKKTLAATQADVNAELLALRDPDQAHLIALGGWIRALTAAAASLLDQFDPQKAKALFYPDAPDYFHEILDWLNPSTAKKINAKEMQKILIQLTQTMNLKQGELPKKEQVKQILEYSKKLSTLCVGSGYEY